jgi:hypothetical protein
MRWAKPQPETSVTTVEGHRVPAGGQDLDVSFRAVNLKADILIQSQPETSIHIVCHFAKALRL